MFSVLYKSNIIKSKDKMLIVFLIAAITYSLIHYIIFNDFFNSFNFTNYIHIGFYIIFFIDFCLFIKLLTEDRLNDEIIKNIKEKETIQDYYGKIIEQLSSEINLMQQIKSNTNEQKEEKVQETQREELQNSTENQNNNEKPIKLDEKIEEKVEIEKN